MSDLVLKAQDIKKYYGNRGNMTKAIDGINLNITKGDFIGIMGASGSGKTTLLNVLSTIDTVTNGKIVIESKDITKLCSGKLAKFRREQLGFIFQDFNLLDNLTLGENISLALAINKVDKNTILQRVQEVASLLGIENQLNKYPHQVSGGQKQRAAAARAIVNSPNIIFADEPTGALDSKSSQNLLSALRNINKQLQATILLVTHDAHAASYCKKVLFLKDGKIFNELCKGNTTRRQFFDNILEVVAVLEGYNDYDV